MKPEELSALTDRELLDEAKKAKRSSVAHALVIGFMIGVIVYSVVKSTWGFFTLIPLFFIYRLTRRSNDNEALQKILRERNLKP